MVDPTMATGAAVDPSSTATLKAPTSTRARPGVETRGAMVGRYVVLSTLGAGAMGVVLAAYDPDLDRKVALKLLKHHASDEDADRLRLQREAQALAKLDHQNVVGVHDVGLHAGQLFIAMDFIAGQTLGAWMETRHDWRTVLDVFGAAGRGLAAAHEAGLIHRDFKPDNVMLGEDGRVRVMDFGLARASHEGEGEGEEGKSTIDGLISSTGTSALASRLTQTGALLGTPAYMSAEQFFGLAADAQSDQFGFCVALYEALYGHRPFAGRRLSELVEAVNSNSIEPEPKSSGVPTWIRRVVTRGLSPVPELRHPSMEALLEALADDPGVRRRRRGLGLLAVAALVGGTWGLGAVFERDAQTCMHMDAKLVGVWDGARRAEVGEAIEATGLGYAADTRARVEQRLDDYAQAWTQARGEACEASHRGEQSGELLDRRMACLDTRLAHLDALVEVFAEADEAVVRAAVQAAAALPGLDRCADLEALRAAQPPPEDPQTAARVAALDKRLVNARALRETGQYAAALAVVDAVVDDATRLDYAPLKVRALLGQGSIQEYAGDYAKAEVTLQRSYQLALSLGMQAEAARASATLVYVVGHRQARHQDARRWLVDAEPLSTAVGSDEARALLLNNLSALALSEGNLAEARDTFEQALALGRKAESSDDPLVASGLNNLGVQAQARGEYEEAREYYQRSLVIYERSLGPGHPKVAGVLNNLGVNARAVGDLALARDYYERVLTLKSAALGPSHPELARVLQNLGNVAQAQARYAEAREYYERAMTLHIETLGASHPDVARSHDALGVVATIAGDFDEARASYQRGLEIRERLGPDHPSVSESLTHLGMLELSLGAYDDARPMLERALLILEATKTAEDPAIASGLTNLGNAALGQGEFDYAQTCFERATTIRLAALGAEHPHLAWSLTGLGRALLGRERAAEAIEPLERALAIREAREADVMLVAQTRFALAQALWDADQDRDRARALAQQARTGYAGAGERGKRGLVPIEAWLGDPERSNP